MIGNLPAKDGAEGIDGNGNSGNSGSFKLGNDRDTDGKDKLGILNAGPSDSLPLGKLIDGGDGSSGNSGNFKLGKAGLGIGNDKLGIVAPGIPGSGKEGNSGIATLGNAGIGIGKEGKGILCSKDQRTFSPIFASVFKTITDMPHQIIQPIQT